MATLIIQNHRTITVYTTEMESKLYKFKAIYKKSIAGEMMIVVEAEDICKQFTVEMHFPVCATNIIYQNPNTNES